MRGDYTFAGDALPIAVATIAGALMLGLLFADVACSRGPTPGAGDAPLQARHATPAKDVPDTRSEPDWERLRACTKDCSGHRAGYAWAEAHEITDADDCPARPRSRSFAEGCQMWVEDTTE